MATDPYEAFRQVVPKIVADEAKLDQWINGGENDTVQTDGGPIPTWAGVVSSLNSETAITETGQNRAASEEAAERAETAASIADSGAQIYSSVSDGLDGTTDGQYFRVISGPDSREVATYRNDAGTKSLVMQMYTKAAIDPVVGDYELRRQLWETSPSDSEYVYVIGDEAGYAAIGVSADGKTSIMRHNEHRLEDRQFVGGVMDEDERVSIGYMEDGRTFIQRHNEEVIDDLEFVYGVIDEDNRLAWGVRADGTFYPESTATDEQKIIQPKNRTLKVIYAIGQSLSVGGGIRNSGPEDITVVSVPPRPYGEYCLMLNTGISNQYRDRDVPLSDPRIPATGFESAYEVYNDSRFWETHGTGLIERILIDADLDQRDTMLFRTGGRGGSTYGELSKGSEMYAYSLDDIRDIVSIAGDRGWSVEVVAMTVTHGEANRVAGTTGYIDLLRQWKADYQSDIQSITGQTSGPLFFPDQLCNQFEGDFEGNQIILDFLDWSEEDPEVFLSCPKYQLPFSNYVHLTPEGYRLMGELHGRAIQRVLSGGDWEPLKATSVTLSGNVVTVTTNATSQLVADTEFYDLQSQVGFEFLSDSVPVRISGVDFQGVNQIILTLSSEPSGSEMTLDYAFTKRGGNIRDSSGGVTMTDSLPLHNWLVSFKQNVTQEA